VYREEWCPGTPAALREQLELYDLDSNKSKPLQETIARLKAGGPFPLGDPPDQDAEAWVYETVPKQPPPKNVFDGWSLDGEVYTPEQIREYQELLYPDSLARADVEYK